jgi:hypothetical protein
VSVMGRNWIAADGKERVELVGDGGVDGGHE